MKINKLKSKPIMRTTSRALFIFRVDIVFASHRHRLHEYSRAHTNSYRHKHE